MAANMEYIAEVERIKFRSDDGTVIAATDTVLNGNETAVIGPDCEKRLQEGVRYRFFGQVREHAKHGQQFKFTTFVPHTQVSRRGVVLYLSKLCDGIGDVLAQKMWKQYGSQAVEVLRNTPARVVADGVLSAQVASLASEVLKANAVQETTRMDLMDLFDGRRFPSSLIGDCIERWGVRAAELIRANPLRLLTSRPKLPGCGFERVTRMYTEFGGKVARRKYLLIVAWNYMRNENRYGHTWFRAADVGRAIGEALSVVGRHNYDPERLNAVSVLRYGIRSGWLAIKRVGTERYVTVREFAEDEERLAVEVRRLLRGRATLATVAEMQEVGEMEEVEQ